MAGPGRIAGDEEARHHADPLRIPDGLTSYDVAVFDELDGGYCHRAGADPLSLVPKAGAVGGDDFFDAALTRMRAADAVAG